MLESGVQVQVQWTAGETAAMESGTSYSSQLSVINTEESYVGANYTCTASLVSTLSFIYSSDTLSNFTTIPTQSKTVVFEREGCV